MSRGRASTARMREGAYVLALATALVLSACSGTASDEPASQEGDSALTTGPAEEAMPATQPPAASPEAPEESSQPEPSATEDEELSDDQGDENVAAETARLIDMLWGGTEEERTGMCAMWRSGDLIAELEESSIDFDREVAETAISEKCQEVGDGSRQRPFDIDQSLATSDGWSLRVVQPMMNAEGIVMATNQFNDPPQPGYEFLMFDIEVTYEGANEPVNPYRTFDFAIVGSGGNTFTDDCGVIPNRLRDVGDMYSGATATGNICISAPSDQLDGGTLRVGPRRGEPVFMLLPEHRG